MSEDIKLFVSCHKLDTHIPDNALLQPIRWERLSPLPGCPICCI